LETLHADLKHYSKLLGSHHALVAHIWNLIGNAHFRSRDYHQALEAYKRAVECSDKHLGDSYANIGTVYWAMGDVDRSIAFLLRAKQVYEFAVWGDTPANLRIASICYELGVAYSHKGCFMQALEQYSQCREIRENVLGRNSLEVSRVVEAIGKLFLMNGGQRVSLQYHQEAMQIQSLAEQRIHNSM
jgi:tetratricopeptide (TPR) repeat protein